MNTPKPKFLVGVPRISMEWFIMNRFQLYNKLWAVNPDILEDVKIYQIAPLPKPTMDLPYLTPRVTSIVIWLYDRNGNEVDHIVKGDLIK